MLFTPLPPPCHKLSHLLGPPPPSRVTYFIWTAPQAPSLRVASWNARSLTDKHAFVTQSLLEGNLDLLASLKAGTIARKILQFYVQLQQDIHLATILANCYLTLVRREKEE